MRLRACRLAFNVSGGRGVVAKLGHQDKRLRGVLCRRDRLLAAGRRAPAPARAPFLPPEEEGQLLGEGTGSRLSSRAFVLQGTLLLWVPRKGLYLFAVFYTFGNIASIGR